MALNCIKILNTEFSPFIQELVIENSPQFCTMFRIEIWLLKNSSLDGFMADFLSHVTWVYFAW